ERLCRNTVLERLAFQQLHHNERLTFVFANVIYRANVRMVESRGCSSFPLKALQGLTVFGKLLRQELEGHETAETGIFSLVHHTHPASAQLVNYAVVPESAANHGKQPSQLRTLLLPCRWDVRCCIVSAHGDQERSREPRIHCRAWGMAGSRSAR